MNIRFLHFGFAVVSLFALVWADLAPNLIAAYQAFFIVNALSLNLRSDK